MTQEAISLRTTGDSYPGVAVIQDVNKALATIATDFAGPDDPASLAGPFMTWADTGNMLLWRRNAANGAWVLQAALDPIATQVEVDAGIDDTKFVTPKKLLAWVKQATETVLGMLKVATQAQTDAGTDDATAITPKKLRLGISWLFAQTGYLALPSWLGSVIFQWGVTPNAINGGFARTTFPIPFPSIGPFIVLASPIVAGVNTQGYSVGTVSLNQSTFDLTNNSAASGGVSAFYITIGK